MSEAIIIQTDSYLEMAEKIYKDFVLMQSCKVEGTIILDGRLVEKGRAVLTRLEQIDELENTYDGKRKRIRPKDSVGGYIAHKIFKYQRRIVNDDIRYTIWRFQ